MTDRISSRALGLCLILAVLLSACACNSPTEGDGRVASTRDRSGPIVEREDVDGVTHVRNLSGSVWPGPARLEEITTIGSDEVEESFFGNPLVFAVTDRVVLVGDLYYGFVRAFDQDGKFLRSYGGRGQGPGEFEMLLWGGLMEGGRVAVASFHPTNKLSIFEKDGTHVADWPVPAHDDFRLSAVFLVSTGGHPFWETRRLDPGQPLRSSGDRAYRELGAAGWIGESVPLPRREVEPSVVEYSCPDMPHLGGRCTKAVPWTPPAFVSVMMPDLTALSGFPDEYRFEARRRDGSVMVVEHYQPPAPITRLERRIAAAEIEAAIQEYVPGYDFDENLIPDHKPAYFSFTRSRDGRLMVVREGESHWDQERCGPPEDWAPESGPTGCNVSEHWIDAFDPDGGYIGSFQVPPEAWFGGSYINGDQIWMQAKDEVQNVVVKGYRIVVPEASQ